MKSINRKLIPVGRLKYAAHNPERRVAPDSLKELMSSMENIGLLHPITVSAENDVIDGHRRLASARILGWKDVECNVVEGDPDTIYADVNVAVRKMSGNDALGVWLVNPRAVVEKMRAKLSRMEEDLGRALVRKIYDAGMSLRLYDAAKQICRYIDDTTADNLKAVVRWLLEFPVIGQVRKAMAVGASPKVIMEAVRQGRPVKIALEMN